MIRKLAALAPVGYIVNPVTEPASKAPVVTPAPAPAPEPAPAPAPAPAVAEEVEEAPVDLRGLVYIDIVKKPTEYAEMLVKEQAGEGTVVYRYRKSFLAKLALADGKIGDYYSIIKNALLRYKGVKARKSWNYEAFNQGRNQIARVISNGKTLYLYLAIDPKTLADTKYGAIDVSDKKKFEDTPSLMKIRGDRKLKFALELIEKICGETLALKLIADYAEENYKPAYKPVEELFADGLIRKLAALAPNGYVVSPVVDPVKTSSATEEEIVAAEDETDAEVEDAQPAARGLVYIDVVKKPEAYGEMLVKEQAGEGTIVYRYRKSFLAKLALTDGKIGDYYSTVKNALLRFKGVKARMSWNYEAFNQGRNQIARIIPSGKTLYLYLAIDPKTLADTKYGAIDVSDKKKFEDTPSLMKIRGDRKLKFALELIEKICGESLALKPIADRADENYKPEYQHADKLFADGLIRKLAALDTTAKK